MIEYVSDFGYMKEEYEPNDELGFMVDLANRFQLQQEFDDAKETQRIRHETAAQRMKRKRIMQNVLISIISILSFVGATTIACAINGLLGG